MYQRLFYIALWNFADDEGRGRAISKELAGFAFPLDDDIDRKDVEEALLALEKSGRIVLYMVDGVRHYQVVHWERHQSINRPTPSRIPPPDGYSETPDPASNGSLKPQDTPNHYNSGVNESSVSPHGILSESSVSDSCSPHAKNMVGIRNLLCRNQESVCLERECEGEPVPPSPDGEKERGVLAAPVSNASPSSRRNQRGKVDDPDPNPMEVQSYVCAEGGSMADAAGFYDYYEAIGWRVGGSKIVDWKAKARSWLRRGQEQKATAKPPPPVETKRVMVVTPPSGVVSIRGAPPPVGDLRAALRGSSKNDVDKGQEA